MNPAITRWWQSGPIVSHINRIACGKAIPGLHAGFHTLLAATAGGKRFSRAISVGCGNARKELGLVQNGIVERFELYELSPRRLELGQSAAKAAGVGDRMAFHLGNPVGERMSGAFDLVYWNNALHHMLDVEVAIAWSHDCAQPGGTIAIDDFTGPSRFQWTESNLRVASRARELLPDRLLRNPAAPGTLLPRVMQRPDPVRLAEVDPSEAADSSRIIDVWMRFFPQSRLISTGGAIYNLALNDAIANFTPDDHALLNALLLADEALAHGETNHYTIAIATR
jgi:SAM-dependent methyltransferase